jgi:hypothetical protein
VWDDFCGGKIEVSDLWIERSEQKIRVLDLLLLNL